jgi:DNA-binding CsgD family transcriptional regulator
MQAIAMEPPLEISVTCPVLIGCEQQLATLAHLIARVRDGRGQAALIAGEAGSGKSRLVAEAKVRAAAQGFSVLQGRCFEQDRTLPYAPLRDLLRALLGAHPPDAVSNILGPPARHLLGLLPELAALPSDLAPTWALDPEQERRRITQAFVQFFAHQAARQPHVVVIEDLHWSDETSLEALLTLARRISIPILLLLTYRGDEAPPPLAQMLAALERERLAGEMHLARLSYAEVDTMLRAIFGQPRPIRTDFLSAIYALTEGNPFFIEEILKSLISSGQIFYANGQWDRRPLTELNIPRTVQVAVRQRVERLSSDARRLLTFAAAAGRRFDFELLLRLTSHDEATLLELIKSLIAAQLVIEETAETFAFRHALTREALYADLLTRERKALHGAIAEALEAIVCERGNETRDVWVADLAYHCFAAELWRKALEYAWQAAERAQRLFAPHAALEQLTRALDALRHLGEPPPLALHRARGRAYETLGMFDRACEDYQAALERAQATGERTMECQVLLDLGFLWAERDYIRMGEYRQRALDLARTLDNPNIVGHSLNRVGNWHLFVEQPREALRYHQETLEQFRSADDRRGLAATYDLMGATSLLGGDVPAGVEHYHQAIALFRELGDLQGLSSSLATFSIRGASYLCMATAWPLVDAAECVRDGEEALRLACQIGWRAGEAGALVALASGHGPRGDYAVALEHATSAREISQEIENGAWLIGALNMLGAIALDLLALQPAREYLEQALKLAHGLGSYFVRNIAGYLAATCVAQRDFARAAAVLIATLDADTPMEMQGQRATWCARADLTLAVGDAAQALEITDRLIASAAHAERYGAGCIPRVWHLRGAALAALGRVEQAETALLAADQGAALRGLRPARWRIQASLGKLYQSQARRKQADAAFTLARSIVEELATAIPERELREGFLRSAAAQLPRPSAPTRRHAIKASFDGLTEREREIATLIAQGRINREIAEALIVGERTVETHISNILSKLSFTSRRQIAAWAIEKGLAKRVE